MTMTYRQQSFKITWHSRNCGEGSLVDPQDGTANGTRHAGGTLLSFAVKAAILPSCHKIPSREAEDLRDSLMHFKDAIRQARMANL